MSRAALEGWEYTWAHTRGIVVNTVAVVRGLKQIWVEAAGCGLSTTVVA